MERIPVQEGTKKQVWGHSDGEPQRELPEKENVRQVRRGPPRLGRESEGCEHGGQREQVGNRHVLQKRQGSAHRSREGGRKEKQGALGGKGLRVGRPQREDHEWSCDLGKEEPGSL